MKIPSQCIISPACNDVKTLFGDSFVWEYSGAATAEKNMSADAQMLSNVIEKKTLPTFRVYGWKPFAISLGKFQRSEQFDREALLEAGVDIVRRPTGGRAVFHALEATYSFATSLDGHSPATMYSCAHTLILRALNTLCSNALTFGKSSLPLSEHYRNSPLESTSCFTSFAKTEIEWNHKKIVGSAQYVSENTLLQHGSILLENNQEKMADFLHGYSELEKQKIKTRLNNSSAGLCETTDTAITFDQVAIALYYSLTGEIS